MTSEGLLRIVLSGAAGAISFAALPVAILCFIILLAQDNPASEEDVSRLMSTSFGILGLGALIGIMVALLRMSPPFSAAFGISIPLVLTLIVSIIQLGAITENTILAILVFCIVPGSLAGLVSSYVSRKLA